MKDRIIENVQSKLMSLGYTIKDTDSMVLNFAYDKAKFEIKSFCNVRKLTEDFVCSLIDLTTSYFLEQALLGKCLSGEEISKTVKSISEGDISLSYDTINPEEALKGYIDRCIENVKSSLVHYRRIQW